VPGTDAISTSSRDKTPSLIVSSPLCPISSRLLRACPASVYPPFQHARHVSCKSCHVVLAPGLPRASIELIRPASPRNLHVGVQVEPPGPNPPANISSLTSNVPSSLAAYISMGSARRRLHRVAGSANFSNFAEVFGESSMISGRLISRERFLSSECTQSRPNQTLPFNQLGQWACKIDVGKATECRDGLRRTSLARKKPAPALRAAIQREKR